MMLLIAKYGAVSAIPLAVVARDYFDMSQGNFLKALKSGRISGEGLDLAQARRHGIPLIWLTKFIEMRRARATELTCD